MLSYPETAPKIDWAYYKQNITAKSVVDQLEASYKALNITYPVDNVSDQIAAQEAANEKEAEAFIQDSKQIQTEANKMVCISHHNLSSSRVFVIVMIVSLLWMPWMARLAEQLDKFKVMITPSEMTEEEFALTFPDWAVRQSVRPSWWPHEETTPGLSQAQRDEITKSDGPPYSLI
jgi:hypothetical protein